MEKFKVTPDKSIFFELSPDEATLFFYAVGVIVAQPLTISEVNVLANGFFEIAQVLFLIAAQRNFINDAITAQKEKENVEKTKEANKSTEKLELRVKLLQEQIEYLQRQMDELKQ